MKVERSISKRGVDRGLQVRGASPKDVRTLLASEVPNVRLLTSDVRSDVHAALLAFAPKCTMCTALAFHRYDNAKERNRTGIPSCLLFCDDCKGKHSYPTSPLPHADLVRRLVALVCSPP